MMRAAATTGAFGLMVVLLLASSGCEGPPVPSPPRVQIPRAAARVTSSALTKRVTNAETWRIYKGMTQMVLMGFGADGNPVNGLRIRFASGKTSPWAVSAESLSTQHVLQVDSAGQVV